MDLFINPADELPIYRQIMRQITSAIAGNHLRPGDKLTSHRDLAEHLVIAPLTVKKAYDELERQGLIETLRGKGTFVSAKAVVKRSVEREKLREAAKILLHQAYLGGLDLEDAMTALEQAAREIARPKDSGKGKTRNSSMPIVEVTNVMRAYRHGATVLDGTSFTVGEGEVVGLLGRNGAGKTTLLRILMGMIAPQGGWARVFGMDPQAQPVEVKRRTGFVAEDQVYPPACRAGELLAFHRTLYAGWDSEMEDELVSRFGIRREARISEMSKGEARQVALICAVCHKPELLILDEPAGDWIQWRGVNFWKRPSNC